VAEASKWKEGMINDWVNKGELACGDLMEKAEEALKEAEEREEAEAKIRIMEGQCEELADLAAQAGSKFLPRPRLRSWKSWKRRWTKGRRWWGTWVGL
jgi:hypothetical protein